MTKPIAILCMLAGCQAIAASCLAGAAPPIGLEAMKLDRLSELRHGVRTYQTSSHERTGEGNDWCHWLDTVGDEHVLLDEKGPGCIYRIWMTGVDEGSRVRIYFDGETKPRVNLDWEDFFSGTKSPFLTPLVGDRKYSSGGYICYVPMPFKEGCRITREGKGFHGITFHKYDTDDGVTTFTGTEDTREIRGQWNTTETDPKADTGAKTIDGSAPLPTGRATTLADIAGPGSIRGIEITLPGFKPVVAEDPITDDGRAFGEDGYCEFDVSIDARNTGVKLVRRLNYRTFDQRSRVYIDGADAGEWYTPRRRREFFDAEFEVAPELTAGKSSIHVKVEFVSARRDWNEFHYWAYSKVDGEYVRTDALDVGDKVDEAAHNYAIVGQVWEGEFTAGYPPEVDPVFRAILENARIQATWDGAESPQVDCPLGALFGTLSGPREINGLPCGTDAPRLYCWFPMPFAKGAHIEVTNSSSQPISEMHYRVRYTPFDSPAEMVKHGYFHATEYREHPTTPDRDYIAIDTTGSGHFVGIIEKRVSTDVWILEGDERIYADGSLTPQLYGTGTEDFYNGGWYFGEGRFSLPTHGNPTMDWVPDAYLDMYRFFISDLIPFTQSLKVGIEHGPRNNWPGDITSVVFYYKRDEPLSRVTDELNVGDADSEEAHNYTITEPTETCTLIGTFYEGDDDDVPITDSGRMHRGKSKFTLAIDPDNAGVLLRRRLDYSMKHQQAQVFIDDVEAGRWYSAGENWSKRWRDAELMIPAALTKGKREITVRVEDIDDNADWSEFRYWALTLKPIAP